MIWRGQDKGRGPFWPKPLSAHRFSWDVAYRGWDVESARSPIAPEKSAGTQPCQNGFGRFLCFWRGVYA